MRRRREALKKELRIAVETNQKLQQELLRQMKAVEAASTEAMAQRDVRGAGLGDADGLQARQEAEAKCHQLQVETMELTKRILQMKARPRGRGMVTGTGDRGGADERDCADV